MAHRSHSCADRHARTRRILGGTAGILAALATLSSIAWIEPTSAQEPPEKERHRHRAGRNAEGADVVPQDQVATPAAGPAATQAPAPVWYVSLHGDGAEDEGGNDGLLAFAPDGRALGDPLGPAPDAVGKVHGMRGMLLLADGTLLAIAAWKENTMILRYDRPGGDGVRPCLGVFARGSDANQLLAHPYALALGPDGAVYASNQDSNTVTRYGGPGTPLAGMPLGPDGAADVGRKDAGLVVPSRDASPAGRHAPDDRERHDARDASRGIKEVRGIAFGPDGSLYVADRGDGEVSRWDPATGTREATIASKANGLSTPIQLLFSPDGASLFISDNKENSVFRVALADGAVTRFIGPSAGLDAPSALAIDGRWLYVGSRKGKAILRFDLATGAPDAAPFASGLPDNPEWFVRGAR